MNSHEVFIHTHRGCFAGTGAIVRLPQCQWSKPDGYGKNQSMYNHNKAQQSKIRVHISWDILYGVGRVNSFSSWFIAFKHQLFIYFCFARHLTQWKQLSFGHLIISWYSLFVREYRSLVSGILPGEKLKECLNMALIIVNRSLFSWELLVVAVTFTSYLHVSWLFLLFKNTFVNLHREEC